MNKRFLTLASLVAVGALALTGCSGTAQPGSSPEPTATETTPTPAPTATESTPEPTETADQTPELGVAWLAGGNAIALQTFGSGSRNCYPNIGDVRVDGSTVTITIDPLPADQMCTMDYRSQLSLIDLADKQLDTSSDVTVKVAYTPSDVAFDAGVLPAIEVNPDLASGPSAGWINKNMIALLTYGTGTTECWPMVSEVTAPYSGRAALHVELESSTYEGACTADYRPQLHEVYVADDIANPIYNELVLDGAGFENQTVSLAPMVATS